MYLYKCMFTWEIVVAVIGASGKLTNWVVFKLEK